MSTMNQPKTVAEKMEEYKRLRLFTLNGILFHASFELNNVRLTDAERMNRQNDIEAVKQILAKRANRKGKVSV